MYWTVILVILSVTISVVIVAVLCGGGVGIVNLKTTLAFQLVVQIVEFIDDGYEILRVANLVVPVLIVGEAVTRTARDAVPIAAGGGKHTIVVIVSVVVVVVTRVRGEAIDSGCIQRARKSGKA